MKQKTRKLLSTLLIFAILFSLMSGLSQSAFAASLSTTVSSSPQHRTIATSTITSIRRTNSSWTTSVQHVYGTPDYRVLEGTYYVEAEKSLASPLFPSAFASHALSFGLQRSKQIQAVKDLKCVIASEEKSGLYYVYLIWSGVRLNQKVVTSYSGGSTTDQNRTIAYVPCPTSMVVDETHSR